MDISPDPTPIPPSTLDPPFLWVQSPVQAFLRPKTHLTGPAATPGQPPLAGPAGPISCQTTLLGLENGGLERLAAVARTRTIGGVR